jgi:hypothetical protein
VIERARVREVDEHLRPGQRIVPVHVEDAHDVVTGLARDALDGLPHLAVPVNRDLHTATATSNSA